MIDKKIFSIGFSANWPLKEFYNTINKYKNTIYSVYLSPPLKKSDIYPFTTMSNEKLTTDKYNNNFYAVIDFLRQNNIKIDLVLNGHEPTTQITDILQVFKIIKEINPEELTLLEVYKNLFKQYFPSKYFIYSFNNIRPNKSIFNDPNWDSFVLDAYNLWEDLNYLNKGLIFLVNSGCPRCGGCSNKKAECDGLFENELKNITLENYIASHFLFPRDIELFLDFYKHKNLIFKIGSRDVDCIDPLDELLDLYINDAPLEKILKTSPSTILWRYQPFTAKKPENCNIDLLLHEKQKLWSNLDTNIIY